LSSEIENVYRIIHEEKMNMYSSIDSRLDKLESKLTNKK
jgi:ribosome-associated translation inhibitor RaiA